MTFRVLLGIAWSLLLAGCMSLFEETAQESVTPSGQSAQPAQPQKAESLRTTVGQQPNKPASTSPTALTTEELELKMARLWARVDQLEIKVVQQEERMSLLQRGLTLGIVPEKLKQFQQGVGQSSLASPQEMTEMQASPTASINLEEELEVDEPQSQVVAPKRDEQSRYSDADFRRMIRDAQALFNQGKYGQAIAAYQQIHKEFPDRTRHGQHLYWIGLSWYYLKEDKFAVENLKELVEKFPSSPWMGKARFYLAKIDLRQGYRQKALSQFQKLIEDFPGKDIEEMARFEVQQLEETF